MCSVHKHVSCLMLRRTAAVPGWRRFLLVSACDTRETKVAGHTVHQCDRARQALGCCCARLASASTKSGGLRSQAFALTLVVSIVSTYRCSVDEFCSAACSSPPTARLCRREPRVHDRTKRVSPAGQVPMHCHGICQPQHKPCSSSTVFPPYSCRPQHTCRTPQQHQHMQELQDRHQASFDLSTPRCLTLQCWHACAVAPGAAWLCSQHAVAILCSHAV
jgi:hypothetical protein